MELLERLGFGVDSSIVPRTDFSAAGGPDCSGLTARPFWFGARHRVLELPLCRDVAGWAGTAAPWLRDVLAGPEGSRRGAVLARLHMAERIGLSPADTGTAAMRRLIRGQLAAGQRVLTVGVPAGALAPGPAPEAQERRALHLFYDRLSAVLDGLARRPETLFASVPDLPRLLAEAPAPGTLRC